METQIIIYTRSYERNKHLIYSEPEIVTAIVSDFGQLLKEIEKS